MFEGAVLRRVGVLPDGIEALQVQARAEGYGFVDRLVTEWESGRNRFDAPGEALVATWCDGALTGVGGLNRDPYGGHAGTGRLRHLYVAPAWRGRGLGRQLVEDLLARASGRFGRVRLRVADAAAARFYEAAGFVPVAEAQATHVINLVAP